MENFNWNFNDNRRRVANNEEECDEPMASISMTRSRKRRLSDFSDAPAAKIATRSSLLNDVQPTSSQVTTIQSTSSQSRSQACLKNGDLFNNVSLIINSFSKSYPHKQPFFGQSALKQVMAHANVLPGNRVLLYDESQGLVTASALLSLQGRGDLYFLYKDLNTERLAALKALDLTHEINAFHPIRISKLTKNARVKDGPGDDESMDCGENFRRFEWEVKNFDFQNSFDAIVIISNSISPVNILQQFYNFLLPNGSISIYTMDKEEAYMVQAFLIAVKAIDVQMILLPVTDKCHYSQDACDIGFFVKATKVN